MYDLIVVGGGHAGCEASHIGATLGLKTLLITMNIKNIADMPCNPSIGGTAKGIIVREIDALGGIMGIVADKSHFQIKMLNNGKGPAVRSLRAQADKVKYPEVMLETLRNTPNLEIKEALIEDLIIEDNTVKGVVLENGEKINSKTVILTTGTYLKGNILIGSKNTPGGPHGEKRSNNLSDNLKKYGLTIQRLKTGTPPRIKKSSIDFSQMEEEFGDNTYHTFSFDTKPLYDINKQQSCYLLYTNENTHNIIKANLKKSAMYGGYVTGVGPRYCPSIEDKIVRFADKERHQLFLEPESTSYDEWYLQGFSTSMPEDIQEQMVHSLKGLENAVITKYAYAIEYDAIDPLQMKASLENKIITNLFTAGQINGTSGYEEAAAQGLIAGINAHHKINNEEPLVLKRNEAYIGVLIDDLVTKGTKEPYRMLTSRAEFRLILRHDNADLRLREIGYQNGTIDNERYQKLLTKKAQISSLIATLKNNNLSLNPQTNEVFTKYNLPAPTSSISFYNLLKRPEITMDIIKELINLDYDVDILEEVEIETKYEGYIAKAYKEAEKMLKLENKLIPTDIDYNDVINLASEARQKLISIRPTSLGQASRISGVNPSDLSILSVYLKKKYKQIGVTMKENEFIAELAKINITLTKDQLTSLTIYKNMLQEANQKFNLTTITTDEEIYLKHFYDSLTLIKAYDLTKNLNLLDFGTGAGFPGLVLKIVFPNLNVTLVDSNNKKISFLNEVIAKLSLTNITTLSTRIESLPSNYFAYFDIITSRAVAPLNILLELASKYLKIDGYFIPLKSNYTQELEISKNAIKVLNYVLIDIIEFDLPNSPHHRSLLKFKKIAPTPDAYPRLYDKIKKKPL